jgi:hypothetical protein
MVKGLAIKYASPKRIASSEALADSGYELTNDFACRVPEFIVDGGRVMRML